MSGQPTPNATPAQNGTPPTPRQPATSTAASTAAVHAGATRRNAYHALTESVVHTATYTFTDTTDLTDFMEAQLWGQANGRTEYGRYGNPTVHAAEQRLAALEGSTDAVLFSSGMAAVTTTVLALLSAGSHVILTDDCYRRTRQFVTRFLSRYGVESTIVPLNDWNALAAAVRPTTRLLISELPTNPYLRCVDLPTLADFARTHKLTTLIDSTFATPINLRPLDYGIDLVVHSATKYLGGHNDLLAGAVLGRENLLGLVRQHLHMLGAVADPHSAFLLIRGLKTLALRVRQQNQSALEIARFLEGHPAVERVWYPGLPSHPDHALAAAQMAGFGGVVSFTLHADLAATGRFIDTLTIPLIAPSLGGVETLVEQPALMSYFELSSEERTALGIPDNLVRLAVGIEDTSDLLTDLEQALASIR